MVKSNNKVKYSFKCVKCGNCCRSGFEIRIHEEDINAWTKNRKEEFLQHLKIDLKSISIDGMAGYHFEYDEGEESAVDRIKNHYNGKEQEEKLEDLKNFILKNHHYLGQEFLPLPIYSFITETGLKPIFTPKSFQIMLEALNRGIVYLIKLESYERCPFLEEKSCMIHEIKPRECKNFPYDKEGNLKVHDHVLKICNGFKKVTD